MSKDLIWISIGFLGQALFSGRFIIQWLTSEKHRKSVIPTTFWYFSIGGGIVLLAYAVHKQDPVFILGQFMGLFIYMRNLYLIQVNKNKEENNESDTSDNTLISGKMIRNPEVFSVIFGVLFLLMMGGFFYYNAHWDLMLAAHFYDSASGFESNTPYINFMRKAVVVMSYSYGAIIVLGWLLRIVRNKTGKSKIGFSNHAAAFLLMSLVLGPGVLVNGVLKSGFHRARPHQVEQFGGEKKFTPAFVITDQCKKNCSFVSGDTSVAFYLFAFALLFPGWRFAGFAVSLTLGALIGYGRMKYGAHFMSDVIFSGIVTYLTTILVYILLGKPVVYQKKKT